MAEHAPNHPDVRPAVRDENQHHSALRFASFVMDEPYLPACVRYVEMNPVRAGLCRRPEKYAWSSAAAHVSGQDDVLMQAGGLLDLVPSWAEHLSAAGDKRSSGRCSWPKSSARGLPPVRCGNCLTKHPGWLARPGFEWVRVLTPTRPHAT